MALQCPVKAMKSIGLFILFLALAGCAATPRVRYSKLQFTDQPETISEVPDEAQRLNALIEEVRAAQFGDPLFKKNTVVYWIIPEIDRLDLAVTGRAARRRQGLDVKRGGSRRR